MSTPQADLAAIRARLEKATPGPWTAEEMPHFGKPGTGFWSVQPITEPDETMTQADAELIAHAPTDLAALLADVERLEQELKHSREAELSLSASHFSALTAVELQRRAEARADTLAQQVETLRAALSAIHINLSAGVNMGGMSPKGCEINADTARAALGAQA